MIKKKQKTKNSFLIGFSDMVKFMVSQVEDSGQIQVVGMRQGDQHLITVLPHIFFFFNWMGYNGLEFVCFYI